LQLCHTCLSALSGSLGLYRPDNTDVPYWTTSSTIQRNAVIAENINVYSPNRAYVLLLPGDSNLVIYDATVPRTVAAASWSSINDVNQPPRAATSKGPYSLKMQVDTTYFEVYVMDVHI
jgi:hypothetical protein